MPGSPNSVAINTPTDYVFSQSSEEALSLSLFCNVLDKTGAFWLAVGGNPGGSLDGDPFVAIRDENNLST